MSSSPVSSPTSIRAQVEARLTGRVAAPFAARPHLPKPVLATGITAIDSSMGGIPCGEITEIVAPRWCSAGRKSLQALLLARATREQFCALIDAADSFDPKSAQAAGVNLRRLLWVRCSGQSMRTVEQAFKSVDLLLQGSGGFALLLLDLAGVPEKFAGKIPLSAWFRLRAVVEKLAVPLLVLTPHAVAGACSGLTVILSGARVRWSLPTPDCPPHARLTTGLDFNVQVSARRSCKKPPHAERAFSAERKWA